MTAFSDTVSAGTAATANQYNNLRKDVATGQLVFDTAAGSLSAYTITKTQYGSYSVGDVVTFKANHTNTGSSTLNVSGVGAKTLKNNMNRNLNGGDIVSGDVVKAVYDGTNLRTEIENSDNVVIPELIIAVGKSINTSRGFIFNTTAYFGLVVVPCAVSVQELSIHSGSTVASTLSKFKVAFYSNDGQTKHFEAETDTISSTNIVYTSTLDTATVLKAGTYYIGMVRVRSWPTGGADYSISAYTTDNGSMERLGKDVTGEAVAQGTASVAAGTLPANFTPSSLAYYDRSTIVSRLN